MAIDTIKNLHIPRRTGIGQEGITVLAGDIGGTKTNLALFRATDDQLELQLNKRYPSGEYKSCIDIIKLFLQENKLSAPDRICLGVAGPVLNGKVDLTNLNWVLDIADIRRQTGVQEVALINDLESTAYGLATLQAGDFITIHPGDPSSAGNMAIIAPGTGLGEAGLYWSGHHHYPFPTEGGHSDFSPRTQLDIELLLHMQKKYGVVSWEKVVAGPAITDIYYFLRDIKKMEEPQWLAEELAEQKDDSAVVSKAALEQKAAICVETMDIFVRYLARESSNLVLKMKATGGLFLGGGIPPKIAPLLQQKKFFEAYMDCDRMEHLLETVAIRIIRNDQTALMGSAYYGAYGNW